jgi:hypothetical protein
LLTGESDEEAQPNRRGVEGARECQRGSSIAERV